MNPAGAAGNPRSLEQIFAQRGVHVSNGAYVGRGWLPIMSRLVDELIALGWDRRVDYVKEKFGGLRFSVQHRTPQIEAAIRRAEEACENTCEICGAPGSVEEERGWLKAVCPPCAERRRTPDGVPAKG